MLDLLAQNQLLLITVVLVVGLLVGSFLNVVIHRLPIMLDSAWKEECARLRGEEPEPSEPFNLIRPRSCCPACGKQITARENIPVLSYLLLRGRCSACGVRISLRYPLIEVLSGLASVAVAWRFGFSLEMLAALALTWALIALSVIDIDHQLLPDPVTLPVLWLGLSLSLFHSLIPGEMLFISPATAIIGAVSGYLLLWSVYHLFKWVTGKEGMGYGDFKLLAMLGAWLGWQFIPLIVMLSAVVGALVGMGLIAFGRHDRQVPIPFGPYLAAAGWVSLMWGPLLIAAYRRWTGL